ncbi:MAG: carbon starvation protein A [Victivallales bacterium]|nr:carbon starvation protein A [Victivallales bacterium]
MNGTLLLVGSLVIFAIAYRVYGGFLNKLYEVSDEKNTPAHLMDDGVDYVPTKFPVLFGHHFASIAGAGPIVGPILAGYFGWLPAVIWIIVGCIFIGGMHDFSALIISARNDGRSVASIVEKYLGYPGRQIFLIFVFITLVLVVAIFALLIAKICISIPAVLTSSALFIFMAPVYGYLVYKKGFSVLKSSIIFVPLLFFFVFIGITFPFDLKAFFNLSGTAANHIMTAILLIYAFTASVLPVWLLLQPRDYLNSFLLYVMLLAAFIGILFVSPALQMPEFTQWNIKKLGTLFPMLFVVVACGACSGFHSLVSSGTTSKQIYKERDMLRIGYGAMLLEGVVAIIAIISVAIFTEQQYLSTIANASPVHIFASGIGSMIGKLGFPPEVAVVFISLTVSAFMLTTLDTATRLSRFAWQELFIPSMSEVREAENNPKHKIVSNNYAATLIPVFLAGYLAYSGSGQVIWPVFGASNQLLAALSLLTVTLYLIHMKSNYWVALIPAVFMMATSIWALVVLFKNNMSVKNYSLVTAAAFLLIMAAVLCIKSVKSIKKNSGFSGS